MITNLKMNTTELWKDIPVYEGYYQINSFGKVKSMERKVDVYKPLLNRIILKTIKEHFLTHVNNRGYHMVCLTKNNKSRTIAEVIDKSKDIAFLSAVEQLINQGVNNGQLS